MNPTDTAEVEVPQAKVESKAPEGVAPQEEPRSIFKKAEGVFTGRGDSIFRSFSEIKQKNSTVDLTSDEAELNALSNQLNVLGQETEAALGATSEGGLSEEEQSREEARKIANEMANLLPQNREGLSDESVKMIAEWCGYNVVDPVSVALTAGAKLPKEGILPDGREYKLSPKGLIIVGAELGSGSIVEEFKNGSSIAQEIYRHGEKVRAMLGDKSNDDGTVTLYRGLNIRSKKGQRDLERYYRDFPEAKPKPEDLRSYTQALKSYTPSLRVAREFSGISSKTHNRYKDLRVETVRVPIDKIVDAVGSGDEEEFIVLKDLPNETVEKIKGQEEYGQISGREISATVAKSEDDGENIPDIILEKENALKVLLNEEFDPEAFINTLEASPQIKKYYESDVGVWEGYSLKEHSEMVMKQYERYFASDWDTSVVDRNDFRVLLALHDIGKPMSIEKTGGNEAQHKYTKEIMPALLSSLEIDKKKADVLVSLATQDNLGKYVRNRQTIEQTAQNIVDLAESVGVEPKEYFRLLYAYYMCDAGSYTEDANGLRSLDDLFVFDRQPDSPIGKASFRPDIQQKIDELMEKVSPPNEQVAA